MNVILNLKIENFIFVNVLLCADKFLIYSEFQILPQLGRESKVSLSI